MVSGLGFVQVYRRWAIRLGSCGVCERGWSLC